MSYRTVNISLISGDPEQRTIVECLIWSLCPLNYAGNIDCSYVRIPQTLNPKPCHTWLMGAEGGT